MGTDLVWIYCRDGKYFATHWTRTNGRPARSTVAMRPVMYPQSIVHNMLAVILT
jgi:hypothetical protein